ncbi:MAG: hypothetical protein WCD76_19970, partial [Pyrinomonadaceae bacterium]
RDEPTATRDQPRVNTLRRLETTPGDAGSFFLSGLEAGRYRIEARALDDKFYLRAIELPGTPQTIAGQGSTRAPQAPASQVSTSQVSTSRVPASPVPASNAPTQTRETIDLKSGQQLAGLSVRVAEGAASLSGRITPEGDGVTPPLPSVALLRVHLVPADRAQSDDPLRFAEVAPAADGAFTFKQLAPGRYFLLVRAAPSPAGDAREASPRPARWDAAGRAQLRREAEASGVVIVELQPCRNVSDFVLRYPPVGKK